MEAATRGVLQKKMKFSQISQKDPFVVGIKAYSFVKTFIEMRLQQVFSCKIREIFRNTYFEEHLRTTASTSNGI